MNSVLDAFVFKTPIQLRWKDIDQFGHVNNAVYLTYFETGRYYYCRDINAWDWAEDQFIIASMHVDYLRPLFYPGDIQVYLRVANVKNKSFEFHYAITTSRHGVEKIAATGWSVQVMYDLESKKSIEVPARLYEQWRAFENLAFFETKDQ